MKKYYSLREISAELDIPKSTVVKYKDYFGDFLIMVGEGKRKKFDDSAVEVLSAIRKLREEDKLDWLEIKDELGKRYGAGEDGGTSKGLARVEPAAAVHHIEHLRHMVNVLAGELLAVAESVGNLDARSRRHSEALKVIAKHAEYTKRNIELVLADLMERETIGRRQIGEISEKVEKEFRVLNENMRKIASAGNEGMAGDREDLKKVAERLEGLLEKKTSEADKFQLLQRENEILKKKLVEAKRIAVETRVEEPPDEMHGHGGERRRSRSAEQKKQGGWLSSIFGK